MKILYLDLNTDHIESYNPNPLTSIRYGGGGIFVRAAFNANWDITLYANSQCFEGFDKETLEKCKPLSLESRLAIRAGGPVEKYIPEINEYDIICHHHVELPLNTTVKNCAWSVGLQELSRQKYPLFYDREYQHPRFDVQPEKIFDIVIGNKIEPFEYRERESFIVQVSRHCDSFGSIEASTICEHYKIPLLLAGPIDKDYPLLNHIKDFKHVNYLGIISEEKKVDLFKRAQATIGIMKWPLPMNLSAVQALSYNCPIIGTSAGYFNKLIKDSINGFFIDSAESFKAAYDNCFLLNQRQIYDTSLSYSNENMLKSFKEAFEQIVN